MSVMVHSSYYTFETLCGKSKEAYLSILTWRDDHKDCLVKKQGRELYAEDDPFSSTN